MITWNTITGATTYEVTTYTDPARTILAPAPAQSTRIVNTNQVTLVNLSKGTRYYFTVAAQHPCTTTTDDGEFETAPNPDAPTNVVADASCDELTLHGTPLPEPRVTK